MATPVFQSSTVEQSSNAEHHIVTGNTINSLLEQQQESSIQLRLTSLLQTTLKLESLFDLFFAQIQHLLKINSCHYVFTDRQIDIRLGKNKTHKTHYSLNLPDSYLGDIAFTREQRFTESELEQIEGLLGILVYPLRNALDYWDALRQALIDPLTGLGNRGALDESLNHQWQMAQRYDQHFSILMIDIDHFKKVNDSYGHDIGDQVLKGVATCINSTTRQTDQTYRYGGEEFTVILNKSQPLGASIIAERIRENISSLYFTDGRGGTITTSVSIGGSHSSLHKTVSDLIKSADKSLYAAKTAGRDRVEFFKPTEQQNRQKKLLISD